MTLILKVRRIMKLLDVHRIKNWFDQSQSFRCLNLQRLKLTQFEEFILRSIPSSDSNYIRFSIVIKILGKIILNDHTSTLTTHSKRLFIFWTSPVCDSFYIFLHQIKKKKFYL
jgi:hypothetical protein